VVLIRAPVEIDIYFGPTDQTDALDQALRFGAEGMGLGGGERGASPMLRQRAGWPKHGASPSLRRRAGWTEPGARHAFRPRSPTEAADAAGPPGTEFHDRDKAHAKQSRSPVSPRAFYQALIDKGFSKNAAAGLTGNAIYESGGNANTIWLDPPTGPQTGDAAHGAMQWEGVRKAGLKPTLASHVHKIYEEISSGSQGLSIGELNAARSPEEAAALVNRKYERPRYPGASESQRQSYARRVRQMESSDVPSPSATPEMGNGQSKDARKFRLPGSDALTTLPSEDAETRRRYADAAVKAANKPKISSEEMGKFLKGARGSEEWETQERTRRSNQLFPGKNPIPGIDIERQGLWWDNAERQRQIAASNAASKPAPPKISSEEMGKLLEDLPPDDKSGI
jgi:Phage tail lysozyme